MKRITLILAIAIAFPVVVSGWSEAPAELTDYYYSYDDDEPGPPFDWPEIEDLDEVEFMHLPDISGALKLAPYGDEPYKYTMPDSFWYFGTWYEPGDNLYFYADGWVSFDPHAEDGFPYPPSVDPPFPVTDYPNAIMAPLWQDNNPTLTPEPSDINRQWYCYDTVSNRLVFQWFDVKGNASGEVYDYEAILHLGGQDKLLTEGPCGTVFSYHFIEFLYNTSTNWEGDSGEAGLEDEAGEYGITYEGTIENGRKIRSGYNRVFQYNTKALDFICPREMVLRWEPVTPTLIVANVGQETEHDVASINIYDETDSLIYYHNFSAVDYLPGEWDTLYGEEWTPGEFGETYRIIGFTVNERDECSHNDTVEMTIYGGCDDTLRYNWNDGEQQGYDFASGSPPATFLTSYEIDDGVLLTGGRGWITDVNGGQPINIQIYSANSGCGATVRGNLVGQATTPTLQEGWNYAEFPGVGYWAPAASPGNIWAGMSPDAYPCGYIGESGMKLFPASHTCYAGSGPGRGGNFPSGSSTFAWGGFSGDYFTPKVELFAHLGFGEYPLPAVYPDPARDVTCFRMENPDQDYVEADVPITPELAISNDGRQAEADFPVIFMAVDEETADTTFRDSATVSSLGWLGHGGDDPDTSFVTIPAWTPDALCDEDEPFRYYELIGLVRLGAVGPDESDHCPYNDTIRRFVSSLLSHDVGVKSLSIAEEPGEPPNEYPPGSPQTITATVENYGFNAEHDFEICVQVFDTDSNVVLWNNVQVVIFLNWRGNTLDEPYTIDVTFPTYYVLTEHHEIIESWTELEGDMCLDDDSAVLDPISNVEEVNNPVDYELKVRILKSDNIQARFAVPHASPVDIDVFDIGGRWVKSLANDTYQPGTYTVHWDGRDTSNRKVAAGIYLVRMEAGEWQTTRKVVVF